MNTTNINIILLVILIILLVTSISLNCVFIPWYYENKNYYDSFLKKIDGDDIFNHFKDLAASIYFNTFSLKINKDIVLENENKTLKLTIDDSSDILCYINTQNNFIHFNNSKINFQAYTDLKEIIINDFRFEVTYNIDESTRSSLTPNVMTFFNYK